MPKPNLILIEVKFESRLDNQRQRTGQLRLLLMGTMHWDIVSWRPGWQPDCLTCGWTVVGSVAGSHWLSAHCALLSRPEKNQENLECVCSVRQPGQLTDWLTGRMTGWPSVCLSGWLANWLTCWLDSCVSLFVSLSFSPRSSVQIVVFFLSACQACTCPTNPPPPITSTLTPSSPPPRHPRLSAESCLTAWSLSRQISTTCDFWGSFLLHAVFF